MNRGEVPFETDLADSETVLMTRENVLSVCCVFDDANDDVEREY